MKKIKIRLTVMETNLLEHICKHIHDCPLETFPMARLEHRICVEFYRKELDKLLYPAPNGPNAAPKNYFHMMPSMAEAISEILVAFGIRENDVLSQQVRDGIVSQIQRKLSEPAPHPAANQMWI